MDAYIRAGISAPSLLSGPRATQPVLIGGESNALCLSPVHAHEGEQRSYALLDVTCDLVLPSWCCSVLPPPLPFHRPPPHPPPLHTSSNEQHRCCSCGPRCRISQCMSSTFMAARARRACTSLPVRLIAAYASCDVKPNSALTPAFRALLYCSIIMSLGRTCRAWRAPGARRRPGAAARRR